MCGRFQLSVKGKMISERFNVEVFDEFYKPNYNCAPSQKLPVITNTAQDKISYLKWGLVPFWAKDPKIGYKMINTRAETIDEKPSFKQAFKKRRCLIPANGFYEWKKNKHKIPYRIFLKTEELFAMAGIWETWHDVEGRPLHTFSIITTRPNQLIENIHNRMPVILKPENETAWLNNDDEQFLLGLLEPHQADRMEAYPVSDKVNSPRNNSEDIILPSDSSSKPTLF